MRKYLKQKLLELALSITASEADALWNPNISLRCYETFFLPAAVSQVSEGN